MNQPNLTLLCGGQSQRMGRDKALLDWVNAEIAAMKKDGRLKAAYEKTLKPVYGDKVKPEDILAE